MFFFIYLPIKIVVNKQENCFDLFTYSNLIIHIIATCFLIIQYIYYFIMSNEHKINNNMLK